MGILHSIAEHARSLAAYLPNGRVFEAKNIDGSNLNQLINGLSGELRKAEGYLLTLEEEYFPDKTVLYIEEWERAVGIPDDCFPGTGTIDERMSHIIAKLSSLGIQTAGDFEALALLFGQVVEVIPLSSLAFPPYSVPFFPTDARSRYVIIVQGVDLVSGVPPYDVPFDLLVGQTVLECLFNRLKPDNVKLILRNTN